MPVTNETWKPTIVAFCWQLVQLRRRGSRRFQSAGVSCGRGDHPGTLLLPGQPHVYSPRPSQKGAENKHGVDPAGAGYPDDLRVRRIRQPTGTGETRAGVAAPVASRKPRSWASRVSFVTRHMRVHLRNDLSWLEKPFRIHSAAGAGHGAGAAALTHGAD